ncbi:hypothetical protein [Streptomyces sp. NPDC007355]|uniref:hypothetical protein n=1 Tax=Streptomyces sp. NPDC007355 TaxID=3364778 RepID=UPI00369EAE01
MSIHSVDPVGPDAIYRALVALRAAPVLDPEVWPDGPQDEDRARLLGCLLAKTELELAAVESAAEDGLTVVGDAFMGWLDEVGPDRELMLALLAPRLERTAFQLLDPDDPEADNTPPTQFTACAAVTTAAAALGVHMHGRREDADGVRRSLGRVESCLIDLLQAVHDVRVTIGDAEPDED